MKTDTKSYFTKKVYQLHMQFIVPTPTFSGGTICLTGFFVQSILADRYINSRELRLVSSENPSSVEYEMK